MISLAEALDWLLPRCALLPGEPVNLLTASGRVLAREYGPRDDAGPHAALDGYAVRAAETEGASEYAPLPVRGVSVVAGTAMPPGADAVLPPQLAADGPAALAALPPGFGVAPAEDGMLQPGTRLRPPHLALLAQLGHEVVSAVRCPSVALRVAGPKSGIDGLTPMLHAMIEAEGGRAGDAAPDLHLHAGRSGPGPDDDGPSRFDTLVTHGIAIRPGETAALGTIGGVPALLLPGDLLACAAAFALLAAPALRQMAGRLDPQPITATLARKIASGLGERDAVRVRLDDGRAVPLGASLSAAAGADGLVLVPESSEGYPAGTAVAIYPLP